jgi:hypothetical protein
LIEGACIVPADIHAGLQLCDDAAKKLSDCDWLNVIEKRCHDCTRNTDYHRAAATIDLSGPAKYIKFTARIVTEHRNTIPKSSRKWYCFITGGFFFFFFFFVVHDFCDDVAVR